MRVDKIDITQIKDSDTLLAFYHMNIEPIRKGYKNLLNKKFDGCEKLPFHKFVQRINIEEIKHGDIIIKSIHDGSLSISIYNGNSSKPIFGSFFRILDKRISAEYLIWFFSQVEIKNYLGIHATGGVINRIPLQVLYDVFIPIPKIINSKQKKNKTILSKKQESPVREIIRNFYQDYQENLNANRLETAIILAGAICEAILYEALIEEGVPEKILSQNKTLGTLLEFAEIKELNKLLKVNLTHFENIKQQRNKTIHIGSSIKRLENGEIINKEVFNDFDHIIKNFGI